VQLVHIIILLLSGLHAVCGFILHKSFHTPADDMFIFILFLNIIEFMLIWICMKYLVLDIKQLTANQLLIPGEPLVCGFLFSTSMIFSIQINKFLLFVLGNSTRKCMPLHCSNFLIFEIQIQEQTNMYLMSNHWKLGSTNLNYFTVLVVQIQYKYVLDRVCYWYIKLTYLDEPNMIRS